MVQEAPQTRESDFASRAMTVICCFAVLITVTAIGSDEVPQPGVRNAINLLGGKRKHTNFAIKDRAMLGLTRGHATVSLLRNTELTEAGRDVFETPLWPASGVLKSRYAGGGELLSKIGNYLFGPFGCACSLVSDGQKHVGPNRNFTQFYCPL